MSSMEFELKFAKQDCLLQEMSWAVSAPRNRSFHSLVLPLKSCVVRVGVKQGSESRGVSHQGRPVDMVGFDKSFMTKMFSLYWMGCGGAVARSLQREFE